MVEKIPKRVMDLISSLSEDERLILQCLSDEPIDFDELLIRTGQKKIEPFVKAYNSEKNIDNNILGKDKDGKFYFLACVD